MKKFDPLLFKQATEHIYGLHRELLSRTTTSTANRQPDTILLQSEKEMYLPKIRLFHKFAKDFRLRDTMFNLSVIADKLSGDRKMMNGQPHVYPEYELMTDLDRTLHGLDIDIVIPVFLSLSEEEQTYYINGNWVDSSIQTAFPDTLEDLKHAGKCFAIGEYTASVFHFMRVMEAVVRLLGTKLGVAITDKSMWSNIIDGCNAKIKAFDKATQSKEITDYSRLTALLNNIREAWRNPTMHPASDYSEWQAVGVRTTVLDFLRHFAHLITPVATP